ncbi:MAG: LysM peptidoglycan-binding domain-containing M23 family metallopeptidase [Cyanobacteriota bacterium]|nr:LysM peptidoglycan-binding domain-containing M23 family metallopeptidase [Cyanobacteriota bacterium]
MLFSRRVFTALLSTSVVLPLSAALATDLQSTSSSNDLLAALRGIGQGQTDSNRERLPPSPPPPLLPTEDSAYIPSRGMIRFGDTLDSIAHRYQLSVDDLVQLNPDLRTSPLVVGRQLKVSSESRLRIHQLISLKPSTSGGVSWPDIPDYGPSQLRPSGNQRWLMPARGLLTSGYGWRWGRMHKGIDVANSVGTAIVASQHGRVSFAGWSNGGYGYLVEITHGDGSRSLYAHQSRILVREGEEVLQGQQIGEMGSTGRSTGPHLHFEIHSPGFGAINPMDVIQPAA